MRPGPRFSSGTSVSLDVAAHTATIKWAPPGCEFAQLPGCFTRAECAAAVKRAAGADMCYNGTADPDWGTCVSLNCSNWCPGDVPTPTPCSSGASAPREKTDDLAGSNIHTKFGVPHV